MVRAGYVLNLEDTRPILSILRDRNTDFLAFFVELCRKSASKSVFRFFAMLIVSMKSEGTYLTHFELNLA